MSLCLDTHAVVWFLSNDPRIGRDALLEIAGLPRKDVLVSDMVLLEISILVSKGRMKLASGPGRLMRQIEDSFRVVPISSEIARRAMEVELPHGDPFDRVIVATALTHDVSLVTRDREISRSGVVEVLW